MGRRLADYVVKIHLIRFFRRSWTVQIFVPEIDNYIYERMCHLDPACRPTAREALDFISSGHRQLRPADLEKYVRDHRAPPFPE